MIIEDVFIERAFFRESLREVFVDDMKVFIDVLLVGAPFFEFFLVDLLMVQKEVVQILFDLIFIDRLVYFVDFVSSVLGRYEDKLDFVFRDNSHGIEII